MTWGFTATKNERVAEALDVIAAEMVRLKEEGPTDDELQKAKDYLTGSYALGFDTSTKIAHTVGADRLRGSRHRLHRAPQRPRRRRDPSRHPPRRGAHAGRWRMLVVIAGRPTGV